MANYINKSTWIIERDVSDDNWQIRTRRTIQKGELVLTSKCLDTGARRTAHTIQTYINVHVTMNLPCRFLNHSCSPTLGALQNNSGAYDFYALRIIVAGEMLTFDYDTTEYEVECFPPKCQCGENNCKERIRGFRFTREIDVKKFGKYVANYLIPN